MPCSSGDVLLLPRLLPRPFGERAGVRGRWRWIVCCCLLLLWFCVRSLAGICARQRTSFSCTHKKRRQKKAPPRLRPLRFAPGQTCVATLAGCAAELAAFTSFTALKQPRRVSPRSACMLRCTRHPASAAPQAQPQGGGKTIRAIAALGPGVGFCPGRAQRWPEWFSLPLEAAPAAQRLRGGACSAACTRFVD